MRFPHTRRRERRAASRHPSSRFERLEDRRLLTLIWDNRGDASDQFDAVFGANADVARGVVDAAINELNRVVVGYGGNDFETLMTIKMDPSNPATSARASNTVRDSNGVPISGDVTINTALDGSGNTQWYLDPTPDDHSEFMGTLRNPFARDPTPGGPADGMRDLRTLLVHELGHTMGIASGSTLIYSNPAITVTNTGITDNTVGSGDNSYWLFQGPSVNVVMTDFDIGGDNVTSTAGHNAMPRSGNTSINFGGQSYYTSNDTMQPTSLSVRRVLLSNKVALMMGDMGYDVVMPELFGTFHSVLDSATGVLTIQGGNDDTLIDNVNQGPSSDTIALIRAGSSFIVGVNLGVDVPGVGDGMTPMDQQGAYFSVFSIADVASIEVEGFGGDDAVTVFGDFDFLDSLLILAGTGDDVVNAEPMTGTQALGIYGGPGDDELIGGPGDDSIFGLGGNDTIRGLDGNDALRGGTGNDVIQGGDGNDDIQGGDGNDSLQGNAGSDAIRGGRGNDVILGGTFVVSPLIFVPDGGDDIRGGGGNDIILGDNAIGLAPAPLGGSSDDIHGDAGNDLIFGGVGNDAIQGDDGDDTLLGSAGNDQLDGGDGSDTLLGEAGNDQLIGGLGPDTLQGGGGDDDLIGGTLLSADSDDSADSLSGGDGSDTLIGDNLGFGPSIGGDDTLDGDDGNDFLYGQYGNDTITGGLGADYIAGGDGDDVLVGGTVLGPADASGDEIEGGQGNDLLLGDNFTYGPGVGGRDILRGGDDDDALYGQYGDDELEGGSGDDYLYGASGNDRLDGGAGDDELEGGDGRDVLIGGLGSDVLAGGNDDDQLVGGTLLANVLDESGDDLDGGSGNDVLIGDNFGFGPGVGGPDNLRGGSGDDAIYGQYDDDVIQGGAGDDYVSGGSGNDRIAGDDGDDTIDGDDGDDHIDAGAGEDLVHGGADNDLIRGAGGSDQLFGDRGDDIVLGGRGNDVIDGGAGQDILIAGPGRDYVTGDSGQDILIGGTTRHDDNDQALLAILDEWTSSRSYKERVANISGLENPSFAARLNGDSYFRTGVEVSDDATPDTLLGEAARDWFFASPIDVTDRTPDEELS